MVLTHFVFWQETKIGHLKTVEGSVIITLVSLVKTHSRNRALIAMLQACAELDHNLGLDDLEQAASELFPHHCCGGVVEHDHHGGEVAVSGEDSTLQLAVPEQRHFGEEEIAAARWKFGMHKYGFAGMHHFMNHLQPRTIEEIVAKYTSVVAEGPAPVVQPKTSNFIFVRGRPWNVKKRAIENF